MTSTSNEEEFDLEQSINLILKHIETAQSNYQDQKITALQYSSALSRIKDTLDKFIIGNNEQLTEIQKQLSEMAVLASSIEQKRTENPNDPQLELVTQQVTLLIQHRTLEAEKINNYLPLLQKLSANLNQQYQNSLTLASISGKQGAGGIQNPNSEDDDDQEDQAEDEEEISEEEDDSSAGSTHSHDQEPRDHPDSPRYSNRRPPSLSDPSAPTILPPVNADVFPSSPHHPTPGQLNKVQRPFSQSNEHLTSQIVDVMSRVQFLEQEVAVYAERVRSLGEINAQTEREIQTMRRELGEATKREKNNMAIINKLIELLQAQ
ncbi:hypothetical protein BLNAU_6749 [Blattamonas nauphoetae]|uniref:Uncharacterized protein n=1 Tax=Blattamonas nauphoetae TaxID=2049346 RepID=A0ABQ9Y3E5_9EUKA|nr:hypothetical protein BLNAU_6749 [Blattamonas nauphoetae]